MDYIDYQPPSVANPATFPAVSASSAGPKTLYQAHTGVTYVNVGGGWTPLCQAASGSFYAVLDAATKQNVLTNLASSASVAPAISAKAANVVAGH